MPYFHVFIGVTYPEKREIGCMLFNLSEKELKRNFTVPYEKNKPIMAWERFIQPSEIDVVHIFASKKRYQELTLPNGKPPIDEEDQDYVWRCFARREVKGVWICTYDFITSPPKEKQERVLMESAAFLGLDTNWSMATCALQLQEVSVALMANRKKIKLDKANVEKVLNKKVQSLSFNHQYEAFSKLVKVRFDIEMPILTTLLRRMRTKVLHEGYNPKPEETDSIVRFTIGLLQKLNNISQTT